MMALNENVSEGLGCAIAAIGIALAVVLLVWAIVGFPGLA